MSLREQQTATADVARVIRCDPGSSRGYDIHVTSSGFDGLVDVLGPWQGRCAALVTDRNVDALHGDPVERAMQRAGLSVARLVMPPGEQTKCHAQLERLLDRMLESGITRDGVVVALGGGVIGDLTGLAASLLRRGVACVQVPTSLIAQTDAAIGGKTAINTAHGKNLVGTFHQPAAVFAATHTLATLPDEEMRAGMAEVVKYALLDGPEFLSLVEQGRDGRQQGDTLTDLVARCASLKARIVEQDEREGGIRRLLNLGHTVGHAVERALGYGVLRHGEAVSIGLVAACELSRERGMFGDGDIARVRDVLAGLGLPLQCAGLDRRRTVEALVQDKKAGADELRWILLEGVGRPVVRSEPISGAADRLDWLAGRGILGWQSE